MTDRAGLGAFGERVARERLARDGLRVLAANVRLPSGEVDLVATDGSDLVCVEVRTRRAGVPGVAAETLGPAKLQRMWRCAMEYCESSNIEPEAARLDLVAIDLDRSGRVVSVEHFRGLEVPEERAGRYAFDG